MSSRIHYFSPRPSECHGAAVFVHGLGGHCRTTWQSSAGCWPEWLAKEFPQLAVASIEYDAAPSDWLGHSMPIFDRAKNLLQLLYSYELTDLPLILVGHSLGGVLIKQMLRLAHDRRGQPEARIIEQTKGVVLLATPNTGSNIAGLASLLRVLVQPSSATQDLLPNAGHLRDLNEWYRLHAPREDIATLVFSETRGTGGSIVVDAGSADPGIPGCEPIPIDSDHISICKPQHKDDLVVRRISRFLKDSIPAPAAVPVDLPRQDAAPRVFISYRRRCADDSRLAARLADVFRTAGAEVFIDITMPAGLDWAKEIRDRIHWCTHLVVLLSEDSIESEMLQTEVRFAHHRIKKGEALTILPVRVRFTNALGYELASYLDSIQYVVWEGPQSTARLEKDLLAVVLSKQPAHPAVIPAGEVAGPAPPPTVRPRPKADPRVLLQLGGASRTDDPCYVLRDSDALIVDTASQVGQTLVIKAPRQMGKSSLIVRYLDRCKTAGKTAAFLDMQLFESDDLHSMSRFCGRLADRICRGVGVDASKRASVESVSQLIDFMEDVVFEYVRSPVSLAFDEVDRVIGTPVQDAFFLMLRGWHGRRATDQRGWARLDIALAVATEPSFFVRDAHASPFNVAEPVVRLQPFDQQQVRAINSAYGCPLTDAESEELYRLLGGHPYLTRLACYRLVSDRQWDSVEKLIARAADIDGPFSEHLRALLATLSRASEIVDAFRNLICRGTVLDRSSYFRLMALGLVTGTGSATRPANELYRKFFGKIL